MKRTIRWPRLAAFTMAAILPAFACSAELPAELPQRSPGLWSITQESTVQDGARLLETQKIWHVCLDAKADRALHQWEIRQQQVDAARHDMKCESPRSDFAGDTMSWTMQCSPSPKTNGNLQSTEIRHTTSFVSNTETQSQSAQVDPHASSTEQPRYASRMQRLDSCKGTIKPNDLKPGEMMFMHWRLNGEETLKARERQNLYREIDLLSQEASARANQGTPSKP